MNEYVPQGSIQIQKGVEKLEGYNAGFEKAVSTFQEIIIVLFIAHLIQVFTHRLLHREKPFSITLNDPICGEEKWSWGSEKRIEGRTRRIIQFIDNSAFTVALFLSAFLVIQLYFPAYTYEVGKGLN